MPRPSTLVCMGMLGISLALHALAVLTFGKGSDHLALPALIPLRVWAIAGILLALFSVWVRRQPAGWALAALWLVTAIAGGDERRAVTSLLFHRPAPTPGSAVDGSLPHYRLITFNANHRPGIETELAPWHPDIVFLQETAHLHETRRVARELFGPDALVIHDHWNAVIARGKALEWLRMRFEPGALSNTPRAIAARLTLADGRPLDLFNLHLLSAERCFQAWSPACWRAHTENRRLRRRDLELLCNAWETLGPETGWPPAPSIIAGDFNAPAADPALHRLSRRHRDAFAAAGDGFGATYPNSLPIHRIDQAWLSAELIPLGARTVRSDLSDHRILVLDFSYPRE